MSRFIIWLVTIAGLLPIGFLSVESLRSHALFARMQKQSRKPDSIEVIASASIEIGPSITKVPLSTKTWPAVITFVGVAFVVVGMIFLLPGRPQRFHRDGLSRIGQYVRRTLESHKDYASVIIAKPDAAYAVLVGRKGRNMSVDVFSVGTMNFRSDLRAKVEDFFAKRGITPSSELPSTMRGMEHSTYHFDLVLGVDSKVHAELIRSLFTDVFGVDDSMGLEFTTRGF